MTESDVDLFIVKKKIVHWLKNTAGQERPIYLNGNLHCTQSRLVANFLFYFRDANRS